MCINCSDGCIYQHEGICRYDMLADGDEHETDSLFPADCVYRVGGRA